MSRALGLAALSALGILAASSLPAAADDCLTSNLSFRFQNDTMAAEIDSGQSGCSFSYYTGGNTVLASASIVQSAQRGRVSKIGNFRFNYTPKSGFRGRDNFAVKVCARGSKGGVGCTTLKYAADVH